MTFNSPPFAPLLPGWDVIRRDYIEPALPGRIVIRGEPKLEIFVDAGARRFGAVIALPQGTTVPQSPFVDISILEIRVNGLRCVEIATNAANLFGTFHLLLADITRAILQEKVSPIRALDSSLDRWQALLQTASLMSEERQLGLIGELWLLERLLRRSPADGLDTWVGPKGQSHDFRLYDDEFEVKTTSSDRRIHTVNGADQLAPNVGMRLFLVSLRFVDAGTGGEMLGERVERIAKLLSPDQLSIYFNKLAMVGFRSADAGHYSRRRRPADAARLILIGDGVPRLTADALATLPSRFVATRVSNISYKIDVDGIGFEEGTPEFEAILPSN